MALFSFYFHFLFSYFSAWYRTFSPSVLAEPASRKTSACLLIDFLALTFRTIFGVDRISLNELAVEAGVVPAWVAGDSDSEAD